MSGNDGFNGKDASGVKPGGIGKDPRELSDEELMGRWDAFVEARRAELQPDQKKETVDEVCQRMQEERMREIGRVMDEAKSREDFPKVLTRDGEKLEFVDGANPLEVKIPYGMYCGLQAGIFDAKYKARVFEDAIKERDAKIRELEKANQNLERSRASWQDEATRSHKDIEYYQDMLDRCGWAMGNEAFIADDGKLHESVLRAKVPELVEKLVNENKALLERIKGQSERIQTIVGITDARERRIEQLERDLQSAQERVKQLEKDADDRDLWITQRTSIIKNQGDRILELDKQVELLQGKLMAVTAERDAARAKVDELEKLKADPKPAITVSYSLITKDGTRIDGSKDSVMEVARLTKENERLRDRIKDIRVTAEKALNDSANAPV